MLRTFDKLASADLRGFIVWVPILAKDKYQDALEHISSDHRLLEAWDNHKQIARAFQQTLNLRRPAWDVYLVYASDVIWKNENPPQPTFWMHQLSGKSGADPKLRLKDDQFFTVVTEQIFQTAASKPKQIH